MPNIILIVEDYDDAREYMMVYLQASGYQVYEAADGQEAVKIADTYQPHLILMDISMPVMDGLTATKIIRKSITGISQVPIVAVTAFDTTFYCKALEAGCNEVIPKPVNFEELELVLNKYLTVN